MTQSAPEQFKKVLIFMNLSSPDLVDPAREVLRSLESALFHYHRAQVAAGAPKADWSVRVLVHGHQIQGHSEFDSAVYRYDPPDRPGAGLVTGASLEVFAPYLPADPEALYHFVRCGLSETPPPPQPAPASRALLVLWGHGQGVGSTFAAAGDVIQALGVQPLAPAIAQPTVVNTGRVPDASIADGLRRELEALSQGGKAPAKFDLVILDSCLMASAELAFEFRHITRFLIASQTFVQRPGLNIGNAAVEFLRIERDNPGASAQDRGVSVIDAAKSVVGLVGDRLSGASALTLFRLEESKSRQTEVGTGRASDLAAQLVTLLDPLRKAGQTAPCTQQDPYPARPILAPAVAGVPFEILESHPWFGLFWVFTQLLRSASADFTERERLKAAFEKTLFHNSRQFLDLRDLAHQVHQFSRVPQLQIVALELFRELEERDYGFVVRWRAVLADRDKPRYGGVSVYCPWFDASGPEEFDVNIEADVYRSLDLPLASGWGDFVLGSMHDATAGAREREREFARCLYERDTARRPCCLLAGDITSLRDRNGALVAAGGKPSGPLAGKPSGPLAGKPSGPLAGKPAPDLAPRN